MAQFDVYRRERERRYLLDCQSDDLGQFDTRLVVPIVPAEGTRHATRLHPIFEIEGQQCIMVTQQATAVNVSALGRRVASLAEERLVVIGALDVLITGV